MEVIDLCSSDDEQPVELVQQPKRPPSPCVPQPSPKRRVIESEGPTIEADCGCGQSYPLHQISFLECGHSSCKVCISAALDLAIASRGDQDVCCGVCAQKLDDLEVRAATSGDLTDNRLSELHQLQIDRLCESQANMIRCPSCNTQFESHAESQPAASSSFNGQQLSAASAEHFRHHRFRCPGGQCQDFCRQCGAVPYHLVRTLVYAAIELSIPGERVPQCWCP
jgi:predicted metal-binding protein